MKLKNIQPLVQKLIVLMFFFTAFSAYAAEDEFSTLLNNFDQRSGRNKVDAANKLYKFFETEGFLEEPYQVDYKINVDSLKMNVWFTCADYLWSVQRYSECLQQAQRALPLCLAHKDGFYGSDCYNLIALSCQRLSLYEPALDAAKKGLAIDEKSGDKAIISSTLNTISGIYLSYKRPQDALQFNERAIKLATEAHDDKRVSITNGMASEIYFALKDYDKAYAFAKTGYDLDLKNGNRDRAAIRMSQMASPLIEQGKTDEAKQLIEKAIAAMKEFNNVHSLGICYNQMGKIMNLQGHHTDAANYYNQAAAIFKDMKDGHNLTASYFGLWESYRQSDALTAANYLNEYSALKDSLNQTEVNNMMSGFNALYQNEQLEADKESLTSQRNSIILVAILVLSLIAVAVGTLIYALRQRTKSNKLMSELSRTQEHFYTNITHEFRTPLTVILGQSERIVKGNMDGRDSAEAGEMIQRQGRTLLSLVNQLLDISKVKSEIGAPEWRTGNIVPFIHMLVASLQGLAQEKDIHMAFTPHENEVVMDVVPSYFQKMMRNLINNAIKFTPKGGKVNILTRIKEDKVQIVVMDNGIGIARDDINRIFEPFYQGNTDVQTTGTGVGLALVKQIVTSMGGTIKVESAEGKGSIFTILLPLKHGEQTWTELEVTDFGASEASAVTSNQSAPLTDAELTEEEEIVRILIVEDNNDVARYIASQIPSEYKVFYASNGRDGLRKTIQIHPDIVLADVMMPDMDGLEMCRKIREEEQVSTTPVIIITAKSTQEDLEDGLRAGADAYIYKPFSSDELRIRIEWILARQRMIHNKYMLLQKELGDLGNNLTKEDVELLSRFTNCIYDQMKEADIDIDEIAMRMAMSKRTLRRKISELTGTTPSNYISKIRISYAEMLLKRNPELSIAEIALRCGFSDQSYFNRIFKQITNISPSQYRRNVES